MATDRTTNRKQPSDHEAPFQPRLELEEGDPRRGDFVVGAIVAIVVIACLLWAFGVIQLP
jgi:hypothetical protein